MTDWERVPGADDAFQRFACDPPAVGISYRVLRDEWEERDGIAYRTILEVRVPGGGPEINPSSSPDRSCE